jgi:fucose permease
MAIVGGAVLPRIAGAILDRDINAAFLVPAIAYVMIAIFAHAAKNARPSSRGADQLRPSH